MKKWLAKNATPLLIAAMVCATAWHCVRTHGGYFGPNRDYFEFSAFDYMLNSDGVAQMKAQVDAHAAATAKPPETLMWAPPGRRPMYYYPSRVSPEEMASWTEDLHDHSVEPQPDPVSSEASNSDEDDDDDDEAEGATEVSDADSPDLSALWDEAEDVRESARRLTLLLRSYGADTTDSDGEGTSTSTEE